MAADKRDENYENYGSVDLNLPPDWKRDTGDTSLIGSTIVGHENGKADAYVTASPRAKHQFSWCPSSDVEGVAIRRMNGYAPVTDDAWTINETLWMWQADEKNPDGPRYAMRFSDRMYARPASRYYADLARRGSHDAESADAAVNSALTGHPAAGSATDSRGIPLRPTTRPASL